ncbi:13839_t:CDS:1, partial [Cetraspora pellucida]
KVYVDDKEEYISFLIIHQHYLDYPESDNKKEKEKMELSTE